MKRFIAATPAITDFVQQEPDEFKPATEQTEAWIFFDDDNLYVSARDWESHPERRVANEMRRDTAQLRQNDTLRGAASTPSTTSATATSSTPMRSAGWRTGR